MQFQAAKEMGILLEPHCHESQLWSRHPGSKSAMGVSEYQAGNDNITSLEGGEKHILTCPALPADEPPPTASILEKVLKRDLTKSMFQL